MNGAILSIFEFRVHRSAALVELGKLLYAPVKRDGQGCIAPHFLTTSFQDNAIRQLMRSNTQPGCFSLQCNRTLATLAETRQRIYEEALKNCLEPSETPQQAPRPEYLNLAEALCTPEHNDGE
jgi:hypothetical protein